MPARARTRRLLPLLPALLAGAAVAVAAPAAHAVGGHGGGSVQRPAGALPGPMPAGAPIVSVVGDVRTIHGHGGRASRVSYADHQLVTRRGRVLRLDVRALRTPPRGGTRVRVVGRLHRGVLRARRATVLSRRVRARAAAASGTYTTLVVPFTFSSSPTQPWTTDTLRSRFFTGTSSLRAYLTETSVGAVTLDGARLPEGDVAEWQTITASTSTCTWWSWMDAAEAAVTAAGWDLTAYDRVIYLMSDVASCGWSGLAPYPWGDWAMLNGTTRFGVAAHELGHTFGLDHAASRSCTSGGVRTWISSSCTTSEYGDPFDAMGDAWTGRWFHSWHRRRLGWLGAGEMPTVTASGTYTLSPAAAGAGVRALTIPRGDGLSYHLELRRPAGLFDAFPTTAAVVGGVSVRLVPTNVNGDPLPALLDTTPSTSTYADAALTPGRSVTDSARRITIEALSAGDSGATVRLWVGEDPVADPPPVVEPPATTTTEPPPTTTTTEPPTITDPGTTVPPPTTTVPPTTEPPPTEPPATDDPADSGQEPPVVRERPTLRLLGRASRRTAARRGLRLRVDAARPCPCVVALEIRDGSGRLLGRVRRTATTRSTTATIRLNRQGRRTLARASRALVLRVRLKVLAPGTGSSAPLRLVLR